MFIFPSIALGAGSDELYQYLCNEDEGRNAPIYKMNGTATEAAEVSSQAIAIWCKANGAEIVRENEEIVIKYNNENLDIGTVYNYIENELRKNASYNEWHSAINSPETNFGTNAVKYIESTPQEWIYNRVGEIAGVELTPEEEENQATQTMPGTPPEVSITTTQEIQEIYEYLYSRK